MRKLFGIGLGLSVAALALYLGLGKLQADRAAAALALKQRVAETLAAGELSQGADLAGLQDLAMAQDPVAMNNLGVVELRTRRGSRRGRGPRRGALQPRADPARPLRRRA